MPLAALLLLSPAIDADALLDRMKALMAKPFEVQFSVTRRDLPGRGTGRLVLERPMRMRFFTKWGVDDFESAWTEQQTVEMSRHDRYFYESGPYDRLYQPSSAFSTLSDAAFPLVLLAGDPRLIDPGKITVVGSEKVGGVTCDHLKIPTWDAWVAPDGRLLKWRFDRQSLVGVISVVFEFTNYKFGVKYPKSFFEPAVPVGYRPYGLPRDPLPLQPGMLFPNRDWVGPNGAAPNFESGKPFFVAVVDGLCEPSAKAARALATLRKDIPVWLFSDDGAVPSTLGGRNSVFPILKDKGGRTLDRFYAPGTPLFLLVDKDRRIKRLWYGFEPEREDAFIKEVRAELGK